MPEGMPVDVASQQFHQAPMTISMCGVPSSTATKSWTAGSGVARSASPESAELRVVLERRQHSVHNRAGLA